MAKRIRTKAQTNDLQKNTQKAIHGATWTPLKSGVKSCAGKIW